MERPFLWPRGARERERERERDRGWQCANPTAWLGRHRVAPDVKMRHNRQERFRNPNLRLPKELQDRGSPFSHQNIPCSNHCLVRRSNDRESSKFHKSETLLLLKQHCLPQSFTSPVDHMAIVESQTHRKAYCIFFEALNFYLFNFSCLIRKKELWLTFFRAPNSVFLKRTVWALEVSPRSLWEAREKRFRTAGFIMSLDGPRIGRRLSHKSSPGEFRLIFHRRRPLHKRWAGS